MALSCGSSSRICCCSSQSSTGLALEVALVTVLVRRCAGGLLGEALVLALEQDELLDALVGFFVAVLLLLECNINYV